MVSPLAGTNHELSQSLSATAALQVKECQRECQRERKVRLRFRSDTMLSSRTSFVGFSGAESRGRAKHASFYCAWHLVICQPLMMMKLHVSLFALFAFVAGVANGFQFRSAVRLSHAPIASRSPLFTSELMSSSKVGLPATALAAEASSSAEGGEEWTKARIWNTKLFRSAAILAALGAAGYVSGSPLASLPGKTAATIHLMSFGTWFGTVFYTTFIAGITMFKNLPRKTFGRLQSKLFPKYFMLSAVAILLQLITVKGLSASVPLAKATKALGVAFGMTLINLFYLEPTSTKVMFDRYELEEKEGGKDSDEYKKLAASFGKFHGMSSLTNLIALCGAVAHAFFLASALV